MIFVVHFLHVNAWRTVRLRLSWKLFASIFSTNMCSLRLPDLFYHSVYYTSSVSRLHGFYVHPLAPDTELSFWLHEARQQFGFIYDRLTWHEPARDIIMLLYETCPGSLTIAYAFVEVVMSVHFACRIISCDECEVHMCNINVALYLLCFFFVIDRAAVLRFNFFMLYQQRFVQWLISLWAGGILRAVFHRLFVYRFR